MPVIELTTLVHAPRERVFDLARSVDAHQISATGTHERAVAGVTSGLVSLGDTITWEARRNDRFVAPLGINVFQAKLRRTGVIDFSYKQISEQDGITGLFTDQLAMPIALDRIDRMSNANPMVRVNSVDVVDMGKTVRFTLVIGSDIVNTVPSGGMYYRIALRIFGRSCMYELQVTVAGRRTNSSCNGANPGEFGYSVNGNTLQIHKHSG